MTVNVVQEPDVPPPELSSGISFTPDATVNVVGPEPGLSSRTAWGYVPGLGMCSWIGDMFRDRRILYPKLVELLA